MKYVSRVGGEKWGGGEFAQAYFQLEDPNEPGVYSSFTCNAEFDKRGGYASVTTIRNFRGTLSLKNGDDDNSKRKWNKIAEADVVSNTSGFWSLTEGDD